MKQIGLNEINSYKEKINISKPFEKNKKLKGLLDYLISCTLKETIPKESTIAIEFFKKTNTEIELHDTTFVRVAVSSIRKKLKEYYLTDGKNDKIILSIEKGSYEVIIEEKKNRLNKKSVKQLLTGLPYVLLVVVTTYFLLSEKTDKPIAQSNLLTTSFSHNNKSTLVVFGDPFMYSRRDSIFKKDLFVRDYSVNSKEEFKKAFQNTENIKATLIKDHHLQKLHALSIYNLSPILKQIDKPIFFRMGSDLTFNDLKEYNIIFIGIFKTMYELDRYFRVSNYRFIPRIKNGYKTNYVKMTNGKDTLEIAGDAAKNHTDYGMLSRVNGIDDNKIIIISGFTDTSIERIAKEVSENNFIYDTLSSSFELLFEVTGYDRSGLTNSQIIDYKPIKNDEVLWK
ncbi:MAG: hypothetical protein AB8B61_10430 [Cyclobacteriaceae bacterium]